MQAPVHKQQNAKILWFDSQSFLVIRFTALAPQLGGNLAGE